MDLDRRHEAVLENITAYDLIQDRIEELETEEAIENEKDEVLEQRRHNSEVAQTLIDASQAWVLGERLQDKARDLTGTEDMVGVYARQSYEHLITEYKEFRQSIKKMSDFAELKRLSDELDPVVQDLSARIDKELVVPPPEGSVSSHHSDESPTTSQSFHSKLKL